LATNVAWKNLVREKTRLGISVGGVAFAVLLILLLRGLYTGFQTQATAYIRSVDADLWVAQEGTPGDFFHSVTLMPASLRRPLEAVEGVERVTPLLARPVVFRHDGDDLDLFLVGVDPRSGIGGPEDATEGRRVPKEGELVIDRVFARNTGIGVGDSVRIHGSPLRVSGVASGGNAVVAQFGWASFPDVARLVGSRDVVNYFLVDGRSGLDPEELGRRLRTSVPGTKPLTEDEFAEANTRDLAEGFLPILWVLVVIAFVIGTAVIGLTIYTATIEKRREYGVLKAIGLSNRQLFGIVWRQGLTAGLLGLAVGVVLTFVLGAGLEWLLPSFVITIRPVDVGLVALAALGMGAVSAFLPVRPVARLDPADVFRV
jgi:putative ABC transport system permease protein